MYFPDRGCVHTLLTLYVYATAIRVYRHTLKLIAWLAGVCCLHRRWRRWLVGACIVRLVHCIDDHHCPAAVDTSHRLHRLPQTWRRLSRSASLVVIIVDGAFCPAVQLFWLRASHCTDYHVTSLLFLRVTCPCSLRTYATLKLIRSSPSSSSSLLELRKITINHAIRPHVRNFHA